MRKTREQLLEYSERMRANPTDTEKAFAKRLDKHNIEYVQQVVIGHYIVDFLFPLKDLIVELDGRSHRHTKEYDRKRDTYLRKLGYKVVRMRNKISHRYDVTQFAGVSTTDPIIPPIPKVRNISVATINNSMAFMKFLKHEKKFRVIPPRKAVLIKANKG